MGGAPHDRSHQSTVSPGATLRAAEPPPLDQALTIGETPEPPPRASGARRVPHLDRYVLAEELGRGGMGTVFKAWDTQLERSVAMKVLNDGIAGDGRFTARFIQEARLAARLQHPAVVPVYDVGATPEGRMYFTMRLIEGRTLGDVVQRARSGTDDARGYSRFRLLEAFREVCTAMAYVHEHGIVHRDLKPDNIMVGAYGEVLIMDFGIAKALATAAEEASSTVEGEASEPTPGGVLRRRGASMGETPKPPAGDSSTGGSPRQRAHTAFGAVMGTPAFMAPEQARGDSAVTPLWDVYALGGILHVLLVARPPEDARAHDATTSLGDVGDKPRRVLRSPRTIDASVPPELDAICMRALAMVPGDRYPSARELADDVQAFLEQRPVAAYPEGPLARALKWARRRKRSLTGVAAALLVVAMAVVVSRAAAARAVQGRARSEALAAGDRFRAARREQGVAPRGPSELRAARDRVLGLALTAFEAANTASALSPGDAGARSVVFEAALALGQVALEDEQWGLAASAFERAREVHVDDARAARAIEEATQARTRAADERRQVVARIIERARRGALERDGDYQDALFALVAAGDAATVGALVEALDRVTTDLQRAAINVPSDAPARPKLVALAQENQLAPGELRLARLASEALGRIGIVDRAADALERHLAAEEDELRAVPAALALCRLARPSSEAALRVARDRLGGLNGLFWKLVGPDMRRFVDEGPEPTTAEAFRARARMRGTKGDIEGSLADATRATELEPEAPSSWLLRGIAHRRAGDLDGAISDYSRAIALDPSNPVFLNDRGFAELERGELDAAITDLDRSLALRPASARTLTHRATAYRLKGNLKTALAGFDEAIKIDARFPIAYRGRADAHLDAREPAAAIADYDRAIELDGADAEAWAGRANARLLAGDRDHALADATRAIELDPKSGLGRLARAQVRRAAGDTDGAVADAKAALALELRARDAALARALVSELSRGP